MKLHRDQLDQVSRVVISTGDEIVISDATRLTWGPDRSYYVVSGEGQPTRFLAPEHVVAVYFDR